VSQITDHLGYTVPESWYRLKGGVPLTSIVKVTAPVRIIRRPIVGRKTFAMTCFMLLLCSLCLCSVGAAAQPDDTTGVVEPAWSNTITLEEDSAWWLQVCALFVYWIVACLVWGTYPLIPPRYQNYVCIHLGSIGIVLLQQLLHIQPALANTWLSLIRYGWATHFVIASSCLTIMFAYEADACTYLRPPAAESAADQCWLRADSTQTRRRRHNKPRKQVTSSSTSTSL
jgi:hypothetical protein